MDFLKKLLPTLIAVGGIVITALTPTVQHFWDTHVAVASIVSTILVAAANFAPQPHK